MSDGLVAAILRGWRDPRAEMARQIDAGLTETRALVHLFAACGLAMVASMPDAVRRAQTLEIEDPLAGVVSAHVFGFLFVAPLLCYGVAALLHLAARAFGARSHGFLPARAAFFWALLLGAPVALALALGGAVAEIAMGPSVLPWLVYPGYVGLLFWFWLLAATLAEAEGFGPTYRVAGVLVAGFGALAVILGVFGSAGGTGS